MADFYRIQTVQSVQVLELTLPEVVDPMEFDRINELVLRAVDGKSGQKWVLDLDGVTYMGSAMLGLMVNVRQRIKAAGGKLVLCNMSRRLSEIFRACSMERLFIIAKSKPDALKLTGK